LRVIRERPIFDVTIDPEFLVDYDE